jgi:hypothetical protein
LTIGSLTGVRAGQIGARVRDAMIYVGSLRADMARRGFDPKDRHNQQTATASNTLHGLNATFHYLGRPLKA